MPLGNAWVYIVLLGAAAIGYALFLPKRKPAADQASGAADVEAALEHYMSEIERENNELIELVAQMKQETASKMMSLQEQVAELRGRLLDVEKTASLQEARMEKLESVPSVPSVPVTLEEPGEVPVEEPKAPAVPRNTVRDRYPELFNFYEHGKSIDAIAKALDMQRGEVQLILQLASKEEKAE
ncbi:DUF6115 domain-containing protein [Paenibacillus tuaregi]|uniref:DUF6115 domain-containing protein n=1 Tax=Paenibacillus tuaregi TaxID=1816681 RepID=UPI000837B9D0|nr:hypothetical protein [Paenibacillus tuaregi]